MCEYKYLTSFVFLFTPTHIFYSLFTKLRRHNNNIRNETLHHPDNRFICVIVGWKIKSRGSLIRHSLYAFKKLVFVQSSRLHNIFLIRTPSNTHAHTRTHTSPTHPHTGVEIVCSTTHSVTGNVERVIQN